VTLLRVSTIDRPWARCAQSQPHREARRHLL